MLYARNLFPLSAQNAHVQASEIALMPGLAEKVASRDIPGIAGLIQPLRNQSDASCIVSGDIYEHHYSL